jgi:ketosteroid isomerase-like protein
MTSRFGAIAAAALAALTFTGSALAKDPPIKQVIDAGHQRFVQGFKQGDAKMVASVYAEGAALLPPHDHRLEGRAAIEQDAAKMGKVNFEITTTEARQVEGTAWASGVYKILAADGKIVDVGKWVEIWTQAKDGWKIWRDIWNSDNPPAPPAPAK